MKKKRSNDELAKTYTQMDPQDGIMAITDR